jgi:hypothetical protein
MTKRTIRLFGCLWLTIVLILVGCNPVSTLGQPCSVSPINVLPNDQIPPDSNTHRSSVVGNEEEAISFATITTTKNIGELIDYYNEETQSRQGWVMINSGNADGIAWSNWKFTDECGNVWDGSITIIQPTSTSEPFVTIRLARP